MSLKMCMFINSTFVHAHVDPSFRHLQDELCFATNGVVKCLYNAVSSMNIFWVVPEDRTTNSPVACVEEFEHPNAEQSLI